MDTKIANNILKGIKAMYAYKSINRSYIVLIDGNRFRTSNGKSAWETEGYAKNALRTAIQGDVARQYSDLTGIEYIDISNSKVYNEWLNQMVVIGKIKFIKL